MYALPGAMPKPGVVRVEPGSGSRLDGEIWAMSSGALGSFLAALPQPMTLGRIVLDDGREVLGFGCSRPLGDVLRRVRRLAGLPRIASGLSRRIPPVPAMTSGG